MLFGVSGVANADEMQSMIAAALLIAQTASNPAPVIIPPVTPRTPPDVSMTGPAFDLDCSLVDASMRRFGLSIEQRGGRGYVDPRSDDPLGRFRSTRLSFRVLKDETGLFAERDLTGSAPTGSVETVETHHPELGVVRLRTFPTGEGWNLAAIVYVSGSDLRYTGFVRYSGFCNVTRHEQVPLTEAETAEHLTQ